MALQLGRRVYISYVRLLILSSQDYLIYLKMHPMYVKLSGLNKTTDISQFDRYFD